MYSNFSKFKPVLLIAVLVAHSAIAKPVAMTPIDILSLPGLSNPILSADGKTVVYQVSNVDWKKNKRTSQLWRKNLVTGASRQLTFSESSSGSPSLSPDGNTMAFISSRGSDKNSQIYLMYSDGGEAFKPMSMEQSPRGLTWTNDGKSLFFRAIKPMPKKQKDQIKKRNIIPQFEDPKRKYQLWKLDIATPKLTQISSDDYSVAGYSLTADNKHIIFSKSDGSMIDQKHAADLWMMKVNGSEPVRLTENHYYESQAELSPDGAWLAYSSTVNEEFSDYFSNNIFVKNLKTNQTTLLTGDFTGDVEAHTWSGNGKHLYFTANIGVSTHLFSIELSSRKVKQITSGEYTIKEWDYQPKRDAHLLEIQSATSPGEIWLVQDEGTNLKQVSTIHHQLAERFLLPKQEKINWESIDGQALEGLLTYPLNYKKGEAFPLVVNTHGGPRSSDQYGIWSSTDYTPVLAEHGYGVLMVNHRGGVGYGDAFLRDMVGRYFRNAHLDVLSGVDYLIDKGLADPDKLVKMGWSAGGHMTNKLITFTDRFKAASSGAGTVDWISHYGETDTSYKRTWWFGGKPWQRNAPIDSFMEDSAINELWKVSTPTLIFVGEKDVRVPSSQSKMLFRALRDLGVETELYIAPGEPHGYRKPTHRLFKINKELEWFEKHVHGKTYEHQKPPKDKK